MKKEYQKGNLTVVWQPDLCIHSEVCFSGLPEVFNPEKRPWINTDSANEETIEKQVTQCPSGALSIIRKQPDQ